MSKPWAKMVLSQRAAGVARLLTLSSAPLRLCVKELFPYKRDAHTPMGFTITSSISTQVGATMFADDRRATEVYRFYIEFDLTPGGRREDDLAIRSSCCAHGYQRSNAL